MSHEHDIRRVPLDFALGEVRLFSVPFSLKVPATAVIGSGPHADPALQRKEIGADVEGVLLRSYPVSETLRSFSFANGILRYVPAQYRRFYAGLDGTFDDYLAKFSSKSRSTLRRKVKKFTEHCGGNVRFQAYRTPSEIRAFFGPAVQVSEKTYQHKLLGAGLPGDAAFQEEAIGLAEQDRVRCYVLFHDQRPVSYLFCPVRDGVLIYQYLGYDPEYAAFSPGTVLQYLVFEHLFKESKFRMFDFTEGEGQHKEFFSTGSAQCADIFFFKPSLRALMAVSAHCCLVALSRGIARTLEGLKLKSYVKRLVRRTA